MRGLGRRLAVLIDRDAGIPGRPIQQRVHFGRFPIRPVAQQLDDQERQRGENEQNDETDNPGNEPIGLGRAPKQRVGLGGILDVAIDCTTPKKFFELALRISLFK